MIYTLVAYRFNKDGQQITSFEQRFKCLGSLFNRLPDVKDLFENYEIYQDGVMVSTNYKKVV